MTVYQAAGLTLVWCSFSRLPSDLDDDRDPWVTYFEQSFKVFAFPLMSVGIGWLWHALGAS